MAYIREYPPGVCFSAQIGIVDKKITREIRPGTSTGAFVVCEGFSLESLLDKADLALFFFLGERN